MMMTVSCLLLIVA